MGLHKGDEMHFVCWQGDYALVAEKRCWGGAKRHSFQVLSILQMSSNQLEASIFDARGIPEASSNRRLEALDSSGARSYKSHIQPMARTTPTGM